MFKVFVTVDKHQHFKYFISQRTSTVSGLNICPAMLKSRVLVISKLLTNCQTAGYNIFSFVRLRYLLRICNRLLGRNLDQHNTSLETPVIITSLIKLFLKLWIILTALDPKIYHPCLWNPTRVSSSLWMSVRHSWMVESIRLY